MVQQIAVHIDGFAVAPLHGRGIDARFDGGEAAEILALKVAEIGRFGAAPVADGDVVQCNVPETGQSGHHLEEEFVAKFVGIVNGHVRHDPPIALVVLRRNSKR